MTQEADGAEQLSGLGGGYLFLLCKPAFLWRQGQLENGRIQEDCTNLGREPKRKKQADKLALSGFFFFPSLLYYNLNSVLYPGSSYGS